MKGAGGRRRSRETALRRFREVVCFACAFLLWLLAWRFEHDDFGNRRGHAALVVIAITEAAVLAILFWKEQSTFEDEDDNVPWITLAWASLPAWFALELLAGSLLG